MSGGGYPANNPYFTSGRFDESHSLLLYTGSKFTNLRIQRTSGTIRVSGICHAVGGFAIYNSIPYETGGYARANVPCTNGFTVTINSFTGSGLVVYSENKDNILYKKDFRTDSPVYNKTAKIQSILIPTSDMYISVIRVKFNDIGEFDFTFKEPYIYEGAYLNPPYNFSIDSNYSNPGFLKAFDRGNQVYTVDKSGNVAHWFRIAKLAGKGLVSEFERNNFSAYSIWRGYVVRPWKHTDVIVLCNIEARIFWSRSGSSIRRRMYLGGNRLIAANLQSGQWLKRWRIAYNYEKATDVPETYLETYMTGSGSAEGNPILVYPEFGLVQLNYGTNIPMVSNIQQGSYDVVGDNDTMLGAEYTITDVGEDFTV